MEIKFVFASQGQLGKKKKKKVTVGLCCYKYFSAAVFIMCGSPMDLVEIKNGSKAADSSDIVFILIDLYRLVLLNYFTLVPLYSTCFLNL